jgi:hypothetical protein
MQSLCLGMPEEEVNFKDTRTRYSLEELKSFVFGGFSSYFWMF